MEGKTKTKTKARVEVFTVGKDVAKGEKLQWIVDGGKFKASYLLPDDEEGGKTSEGLLISEVSPIIEKRLFYDTYFKLLKNMMH